jgi:hypothetical protein
MEKKQTAVDWLVDFFEDYFALVPVDIIEQAKAMEKEQMIQFAKGWMWNIELSDIDKTLEQYYNDTFEA